MRVKKLADYGSKLMQGMNVRGCCFGGRLQIHGWVSHHACDGDTGIPLLQNV